MKTGKERKKNHPVSCAGAGFLPLAKLGDADDEGWGKEGNGGSKKKKKGEKDEHKYKEKL